MALCETTAPAEQALNALVSDPGWLEGSNRKPNLSHVDQSCPDMAQQVVWSAATIAGVGCTLRYV